MTSEADPDSASVAVRQGQAWLERGKVEMAAAHMERALSLDPENIEAHRYLAYTLIHQGKFRPACEHLNHAANALPDDGGLLRETRLLREMAGYPPEPVDLPTNPLGKLRFTNPYLKNHHRSGWRYAMESLQALHHPDGVLFEGFLEAPFAWDHPRPGIRPAPDLLAALRDGGYESRITSEERGIVPYRKPWVGFLHNPPHMPEWFHFQEAPQTLFQKPVWQESLKHCRGLFALSEYAGQWLREATGKPVSVVLHPTEMPSKLFDFEAFLGNPSKRIVQIGWWLRRLGAIDHLPIPRQNKMEYSKLRLIPQFFEGAAEYLAELRAREFEREGSPAAAYAENTEDCFHLSNEDYDVLLAENIVFVDLYDASANNTVIECLMRATPLLVNRLPAVEEYLGRAYPLYYEDLADAASKALDVGRLRAAHEYLLEHETRHKLDGDSFRHCVENSEVYLSL